jgi:hypothetical protein
MIGSYSPGRAPERTASTGNNGSSGSSPSWDSIQDIFKQAMGYLTAAGKGDSQMFQNGLRQYVGKSNMDLIGAGMGNMANSPAAGLAYSRAVMPGLQSSASQGLAQILAQLGGLGANIYGQNLSSQTQLKGQSMASSNSLSGYLADLTAQQNSAYYEAKKNGQNTFGMSHT